MHLYSFSTRSEHFALVRARYALPLTNREVYHLQTSDDDVWRRIFR